MSFILIGFGRRSRTDFGETGGAQVCFHCSNHIFYHLIRARTFFTFFFIPIFPYKSEYRIECPVCQQGIQLRGSEIKAARQGTLDVYVSRD